MIKSVPNEMIEMMSDEICWKFTQCLKVTSLYDEYIGKTNGCLCSSAKFIIGPTLISTLDLCPW